MYFFKYLVKVLFSHIFLCVVPEWSNWQILSPENQDHEIRDKRQLEEKAKLVGVDIQKIKEDLQWLKDENLAEKVEDMLERVSELKDFEKHVWKKITVLETWLSLLEVKDGEDGVESIFEDAQEIQTIRENILQNKREYHQYVEESDAIKRTLETLSQNKLSEWEVNKFQTLTNKEFLNVSPESRLRFITVWNISSEMIASGKIKNIEFTFTYDGVFNRELYIRTTAWQVIPNQIQEVTSGNEIFTRRGTSGEFFTQEWKRLKIHEGTNIDVSKVVTQQDISAIEQSYVPKIEKYQEQTHKDIALWALKRWIDPDFAILMYGKELSQFSGSESQAFIEDKLTDIARFMDDFHHDYPWKKAFEWEKVSEGFAWYVTAILNGDMRKVSELYGFDISNMNSYRKAERYSSGWSVNMENIHIEWVSQEEINRVLQLDRFTPGSKEAQILFTVAAKSTGLPEHWWKNSDLHRILSKESNGVVWRLNYTIPKNYTPESFKSIALARRNNNPIGVRSTASGLGQLLLSNVDKYYPDGRQWLWDPLNEAVWMLRYIHDRYKTIETAGALYGRTGTHNGITKTFKEGY